MCQLAWCSSAEDDDGEDWLVRYEDGDDDDAGDDDNDDGVGDVVSDRKHVHVRNHVVIISTDINR